MGDIDFSRGGYTGDSIEEHFKWFTTQHMEYWWYFREVLRPSDRKYHKRKLPPKGWRKKRRLTFSSRQSRRVLPYYRTWWRRKDGRRLSNDEYAELIAISLLNYAVFTGIADALVFYKEMQTCIVRNDPLDAKRRWKAIYASLNSSFNALINIVAYVALGKPCVTQQGRVRDHGSKQVSEEMKEKVPSQQELKVMLDLINQAKTRLDIRHQLDHLWTIWTRYDGLRWLMHPDFEKGRILIEPHKTGKKGETQNWDDQGKDIIKLAADDIFGFARDFNLIYKEMAVEGGYLDQYLDSKGWFIDYSNYHPHNGRPKP